MRQSLHRSLPLITLALLALPAQAWIGRWSYPSVELVVSQATTVVRGKVLSLSTTPDAENRFDLEISVLETLKGQSPKHLILHVPQWQFWTASARRGSDGKCPECGVER